MRFVVERDQAEPAELTAWPEPRATNLMIMLPGALQDPEEFRRAGFIAALRHQHPDFDVALVDPALQFIGDALKPEIVRILHDSVVQPALAHYSRVWMTGISLGGFLALAHAACHPGSAAGLCLLAPYPGTRIGRGAQAIGEVSAGSKAEADLDQRVWHWLRSREPSAPALWLGYGAQDRFADGLRQMEACLRPPRATIVQGGHHWETWQRLWNSFVHSDFLHAASGT